jgi:hypothetical protein
VAETLWRVFAWFVSRPRWASWLIRRAQRTPFTHIVGKDGSPYMSRWWLFNPFPEKGATPTFLQRWCPISVRVHHIHRADADPHQHDHPWNFRTIVLRGWYAERRGEQWFVRSTGDTATLRFGEYHRIALVPPGGATTLFITGRYRGRWGFLVNGSKVSYRTYLGLPETPEMDRG